MACACKRREEAYSRSVAIQSVDRRSGIATEGSVVKAAICRKFGAPLEIEEVDLAPPSAGEVRVQIKACAVCHSDVHYAEGAWGGELPAVYGHEAAGIVDAIGEGVSSVVVGDPVVVTLVRSCGRCPCCSQGHYGSCETRFPLDETSPLRSARDGSAISHGLRTGAFAEYALVEASQVVSIPSDIPFDRAALLACGVITGLGAVTNTAKVPVDASVVVIGTGGVGLNSVQGKSRRECRVNPVDSSPSAIARELLQSPPTLRRRARSTGVRAIESLSCTRISGW